MHVIADEEIPTRGAEVPAEPGSALSKRFVAVRQLAQAAECGGHGERATVEAILGGDPELLASGQWLVVQQAGGGSVIGNDAEDVTALNGRRRGSASDIIARLS